MKNQILILAIIFFVSILSAQQKGISPLSRPSVVGQATNNIQLTTTSTYAVVVGISDYQDPGIPDLRFADKDAVAFANYLRSNAGGNLDNDHLKVLINQQATMAQFGISLDWLMENAKEGDKVIIYFSGHGDVEKKTITQPGFLLCWDAPARVYISGGAFALPMLQEVISTISIQNKAKVLIVTDACRSGTLAGNSVNGAQATAANLSKQYANEIKIMSCQPNEYSIEGEQWGGGRGAFSYHLIDALYGLADKDDDQFVTLQEVGRYLEDHVSEEVAPVRQVPMIIGDRYERLTNVDANLLAAIKSGKTNQKMMLASIESKGIEEDILTKLDTSIKQCYQLFKSALKNRIFLEPLSACANSYYEQLIKEPKLERLHSTMRRNYAAALQDDAQQVMNKFMIADRSIMMLRQDYLDQYQQYPHYLERAAELLGKQHYMYSTLQSRKYFFEGFLLSWSNQNPDTELGKKALDKFKTALQWYPEMPQAYWLMSSVFGYNFHQADSMEYYAQRAIALQPTWMLPYELIIFQFTEQFIQFDKAKYYLELADKVDSNCILTQNMWGIYFLKRNQFEDAIYHFKKAIKLDSTLTGAYINLGILYLALSRYEDAELIFNKVIQIYPTNDWAYRELGLIYSIQRRYADAEFNLKKSIQLDSTFFESYIRLGELYFKMNRFKETESLYRKAIQLNSFSPYGWIYLGNYFLAIGELEKAEQVADSMLKVDSTQAVFFQLKAHIYIRKEQYELAEVTLNKGFALDSFSLEINEEIAFLRYRQGKINEAMQWADKAIKSWPSDCWGMMYLSFISFKAGKTDEAFSWLEKSIQNGAVYKILEEFPDLKPLRERKEWSQMKENYFPQMN